MTELQYRKRELWIPGDSPYEPGPYWVTWNIDSSIPDTTEMFWDGDKWLWNNRDLHSNAKILAYADIAYPIPYEE